MARYARWPDAYEREQSPVDKTVVKAFKTLELLVQAGKPLGVTELSGKTGLQKSNVHRLLSTMTGLGYVRKIEGGAYEPTLRIWEIGQHIHTGMSLVRLARPHLRRLVERTGETAHLAIFDQTEIVYLDKVESPNPVRAYTAVGDRAPAYCTASGKALLAYQDEAAIAAVAQTMTQRTPSTITELGALQKEMDAVRRRGFATNVGEFQPNVAGIAAPVRNAHGEVLAAIGIAGPLDRLRPRKIKALAPVVIDLANQISRAINGTRNARARGKT
jgi:IclR family transcriptional regulator, KDG regulon repressor